MENIEDFPLSKRWAEVNALLPILTTSEKIGSELWLEGGEKLDFPLRPRAVIKNLGKHLGYSSSPLAGAVSPLG